MGRERLLRQGARQSIVESSSDRPGFTVGGPVVIPKLYDGKDKTFFMFGLEHIKDIRPRFDAGGDSWVPTDALRRGDFSAYSPYVTIYDPLTRVPSGSNYIGQPFPGNIIPPDRISSVAKKVLEYYGQPKNPGNNPATGPAGNITDSTLPETADYYSYTGRLIRTSRRTTGSSPATAGTTATASTTSTPGTRNPRAPGSSSSPGSSWWTTCTSSTRRRC